MVSQIGSPICPDAATATPMLEKDFWAICKSSG